MPTIRSSSSLSSRTVMSLRQLATRNSSPVSSSFTRRKKTSGAKSGDAMEARGSPDCPLIRARARLVGWAMRAPALGSCRGVPPCGLRGRTPAPATSADLRMARVIPRVITAPAWAPETGEGAPTLPVPRHLPPPPAAALASLLALWGIDFRLSKAECKIRENHPETLGPPFLRWAPGLPPFASRTQ